MELRTYPSHYEDGIAYLLLRPEKVKLRTCPLLPKDQVAYLLLSYWVIANPQKARTYSKRFFMTSLLVGNDSSTNDYLAAYRTNNYSTKKLCDVYVCDGRY